VFSRPRHAADLAAMIIHEFQHSRLSALEHLVPLSRPDPPERFYAPWRDDPRPVGGLLQGMYAHFGMTLHWRALANPDDRRGEFEYAYHRMITWQVVELLRRETALTDIGRRFVDAIADVLRPWQAEPIPAEARQVALDHYLGWRVRHIPADPLAVKALAEGWVNGKRPTGLRLDDQNPVTVPDGGWSHARADLVRLVLTQDAADLATVWRQVPDATEADLALVAGHSTDAAQEYRTALLADPDSPSALVGLALALSAESTSRAVRTLMRHPELVRAVHRRLRPDPPTVEDLAAWIGRVID
jgi:hypothetical protein